MTEENYRKALNDALAEMTAISRRMTQLKTTVEALNNLLQEAPKGGPVDLEILSDPGITDAIRAILRNSDMPLTPSEVKAKLSESGFNLVNYANAAAVVHNTLKRLEKQGEIDPVIGSSSGNSAYVWISEEHRWERQFTQSIGEAQEHARKVVEKIQEQQREVSENIQNALRPPPIRLG